jgi:TM2 domain-containing membrane protein YozV
MYKIIGANGHEYGPVTGEQLRQWIADGRANAQTKAQAEGSTDWKPLADFPEFHAMLGISPNVPPPISSPPQLAGADKKIIAGIFAILFGTLGIHKFILGYTHEGVTMLLISLLTCGIGASVMFIISLIEGITYLTKSDEDFVQTYVLKKKGWF